MRNGWRDVLRGLLLSIVFVMQTRIKYERNTKFLCKNIMNNGE